MASWCAVLGLFVVLVGWNTRAAAQERPARLDSVRTQIQTTLRSFYFNLAHQDWEALTSDILAAKVVAHRPAPEALVTAANRPRTNPSTGVGGGALSADQVTACSSGATARVDRAIITLDGDWAEVSIPSCSAAPSAVDEFRLIKFEDRWRIVYIDLFQEPLNISTDR
jgi:hypothetical protein